MVWYYRMIINVSQDIKSIEPEGATWGTVQGFDAIAKKGQEWQEMVAEFHSSEISDPIVAENFFSITMKSITIYEL